MPAEIDKVVMPTSGRFPRSRVQESLAILRRHRNSICHFGLIQQDGTRFLYRDPACYAPLMASRYGNHYIGSEYPDTRKGNHVVSFFDCISVSATDQKDEGCIAYANWLANKSSWAPAFRTKDPERILKEGTIFNVDQPAQLVIGAAMTIRYFHEYPERPRVWALFSDIVDPHIALVLSHMYKPHYGSYVELSNWGLGHSMVDSTHVGTKELKNIINNKILHANKKPFSIDVGYYGICKMWGTRGPAIQLDSPDGNIKTKRDSYHNPIYTADGLRARVAYTFGDK